MKIHKEGIGTIILSLVFLAAVNVSMFWFIQKPVFIPLTFAGLSLIIFLLVLWFFRYPKVSIVPDNNSIICPADGKVVVIEKTIEHEFLKQECIQISVFMSPLNVHINWYPVNGIVKKSIYHKGKFLVAWHPKSSTENERSSVLILTPGGKEIVVRQIAGAVARRIVTYAKEGDSSNQNEQLGFIKFGSRVDLFLPLDCNIKVKIDQIVKGNRTVIGTFS
jgi:phosphatidylserine decarboxylase